MGLDASFTGSAQILAIVLNFFKFLSISHNNSNSIKSLISVPSALAVSLHVFLKALLNDLCHECSSESDERKYREYH